MTLNGYTNNASDGMSDHSCVWLTRSPFVSAHARQSSYIANVSRINAGGPFLLPTPNEVCELFKTHKSMIYLRPWLKRAKSCIFLYILLFEITVSLKWSALNGQRQAGFI